MHEPTPLCESWLSAHLKLSLDLFKLSVLASTVFTCGINIAIRLFLRLKWHISMFLDLEKVAVLVKCLVGITYVDLKVVYEKM